MRALSVLFIAALRVQAADLQIEGTLQFPNYNNGHLIEWRVDQMGSALTLYSPEGTKLYTVSTAALGFEKQIFEALDVDSDGTVATVISRPNFIGNGKIQVLNASGQIQRTIDTGDFFVTRVCFGKSHEVWAMGYEYEKDDFNVFHRYSLDGKDAGKEIGSYVKWSEIRGDNNSYTALQPLGGRWSMRLAGNRIGTFVWSSRGKDKWIEIDTEGQMQGQWEYDSVHYSMEAFAPSGHLYARKYKDHEFDGYVMLNHSNSTWTRLRGMPQGRLLGAEKDDLVVRVVDGGWTVIKHVPESEIKPTDEVIRFADTAEN